MRLTAILFLIPTLLCAEIIGPYVTGENSTTTSFVEQVDFEEQPSYMGDNLATEEYVIAATGGITVASEVDPVFTTSMVYGVTSIDTSNWSEAYSWGDHASAGYTADTTGGLASVTYVDSEIIAATAGVTVTEVDPTVSTAAKGITVANTSDWQEAYSWGDHASAGYTADTTGGLASVTYVDSEIIAATGGLISAELDPTVSAAAKGITVANTSNWTEAYSWGDHATAGYTADTTGGLASITYVDSEIIAATGGLISTELDPTVSTAAKGITVANTSDWQEAYSWGDHASAGYTADTTGGLASITYVDSEIIAATGGLISTELDPTVSTAAKGITVANTSDWQEAYSWGDHALAGYGTGSGDAVKADYNVFTDSNRFNGVVWFQNGAKIRQGPGGTAFTAPSENDYIDVSDSGVLIATDGNQSIETETATLHEDAQGIWQSEGIATGAQQIVNHICLTNELAQSNPQGFTSDTTGGVFYADGRAPATADWDMSANSITGATAYGFANGDEIDGILEADVVTNNQPSVTFGAAYEGSVSAANQYLGSNVVQSLVDAGGGGGGSLQWVDRGDPTNSTDYTVADLTADSTFRDLDLSDIVGSNKVVALISLGIRDNVTGSEIYFRENGNTNFTNVGTAISQVASLTDPRNLIVETDDAGVIEYWAENVTWQAINILVRGWWKE